MAETSVPGINGNAFEWTLRVLLGANFMVIYKGDIENKESAAYRAAWQLAENAVLDSSAVTTVRQLLIDATWNASPSFIMPPDDESVVTVELRAQAPSA